MSDLVSIHNITSLSDTRRTARHVSRLHGRTQLRMAELDDETDLAIAKVEATTAIYVAAAAAVTRVAVAQRHYESMAPEASGRLAYLSDDHLLEVAAGAQHDSRQLRKF